MSSGPKLFGTDGIRGRFGDEPVTPAFAYRLGRVLAAFSDAGEALICIGRDTRESSVVLETSLAQGIREGSGRVELLGTMPTPGISYHAAHSDANFAVAITASHNPYEYNGFKVFSGRGEKLSEELESRLERLLGDADFQLPDTFTEAGAKTQETSADQYLEFLRERADRIGPLNLTCIVDCAHGATTRTAPQVFTPLVQKFRLIGNEPNGRNINHQVGSTSLDALRRAVVTNGADLGIAFDGDGDRAMFIDDAGNEVNGDQILYLLASYHLRKAQPRSGVVGTVMSNLGLGDALANLNIPFARSDVGDRRVAAELESRGWRLGGEPSGHVIWRDASNAGDGVLIAICVLEVMQDTRKTLRELVAPLRMYPQVQQQVSTRDPRALVHSADVQDIVQRFEKRLGSQGRLLVRPSGTEPVVRVMVEHADEISATRIAEGIAEAISAVPLATIQP